MVNEMTESEKTGDVLPPGDRSGPNGPSMALPAWPGVLTGIDVRSLQAGTEVVVNTCNSRYRFVMLDAGRRNATVEGGPYFAHSTGVRIEGSTLGGSMLGVGWIGVDLSLELSYGGERVVTSRVRSIDVVEAIRQQQLMPA